MDQIQQEGQKVWGFTGVWTRRDFPPTVGPRLQGRIGICPRVHRDLFYFERRVGMTLSSCCSNGLKAWHPGEDPARSGSHFLFLWSESNPIISPTEAQVLYYKHAVHAACGVGPIRATVTSHCRPLKHFLVCSFLCFHRPPRRTHHYPTFSCKDTAAPGSQGLTGRLHQRGPREVPWTPG